MNEKVVDSLTRPYTPVVAGRTLLSTFNATSREYTLIFELDGATEPVSVIYVSRVRGASQRGYMGHA